MINHSLLDKYTEVSIIYLALVVSDHSPLMFNLNMERQEGGRPFMYVTALVDHDEFLNIVTEAWNLINDSFKHQS